MAPPSRQSKANALLNTTNNTRVTVVSSSKRNPYATAAGVAAAQTKSTAVNSKTSAFTRRNSRDTGKQFIPTTHTDQLLMGLLDEKKVKPNKDKQRAKKLAVAVNHPQKSHAAATGNTGKSTGHKRSFNDTNTDAVFGIMPPPSRTYPAKQQKSGMTQSKKRRGDECEKKRIVNCESRTVCVEKCSTHMTGGNITVLNGSQQSKHSGELTREDAVRKPAAADEVGKYQNYSAAKESEPFDNEVETTQRDKRASYESSAKQYLVRQIEEKVLLDDGCMSATTRTSQGIGRKKNAKPTITLDGVRTVEKNAAKHQLTNTNNASVTAIKPLSLGIGKRKSARAQSSKVVMNTTLQSSITASDNSTIKVPPTESNTVAQEHNISIPLESVATISESSNDTQHQTSNNEVKPKHASWYNPEEHAALKAELSDNLRIQKEIKQTTKSRSTSSGTGVNDNFVRLDLRNSSGSCRGARNLKKVNKQKAWRAKYRFGKSDTEDGNENSIGNEGVTKWGKKTSGENENKCFASARNGGVDPLDDFMDGVFMKKKSSKKREGVVCTRHSRPCKLMTVKRNNKGNKGRKFYVCSLPVGEKCDFFKWEEDTMEATQRALLQSSSNSGFIARQVAASKTRFKELTVPELRNEAKRRGLSATGKKDQLVTRLLIWTRDEIADSVDPDASCSNNQSAHDVDLNDNPIPEESDDESNDDTNDDYSCCLDIITDPKADSEVNTGKARMIELNDDSTDSQDDEIEYDDLNWDETDTNTVTSIAKRADSAGKNAELTLRDSLEQYFGYAEFREGQEWAIKRCLTNKRSVFVAATGTGKSLCYALPAALMDGICLVVSPLISLMQDQLRQLPPKIPAATLSGSITAAQMALIIDDVLRGRYKVLFVSPERLASASFRRLLRPKFNVETRQYERHFPRVSLLCIDEAHCLSQWGHNFRPSYLRVKSLLPMIEPKSVMALTATAGPMVVRDICNTLCIPLNNTEGTDAVDADGVKVLNCNRDNIDVFMLVLQTNDERQFLLHKILKGMTDELDERNSKKMPIKEGCLSKGSVIIYVWRQKDTEVVAEQLIGAGVSGGVVTYHGGMDANDRSRAQSKFLRGKARICVATVAFGLGINKPDIEGVIHLCLPPSPEHYLQEIGRAGRDGRKARAIALPLENEMISRHSLAHSDRLAKSQLGSIFASLQNLVDDALGDIPEDAGVDINADQIFVDGMHMALPVAQTVDASDCKEESIETILSLLEEDSAMNSSLLSVEGYLPDVATITLKRRSLDNLKNADRIASCILKCGVRIDEGTHTNRGGTAMESGFYAYSFGTYQFSVVQCARIMGPESEPRHVYAALRRLQSNGELELNLASTGRAMHLRMKQEGINLFRSKQSSSAIINNGINSLVDQYSLKFSEKERVGVGKVESMYDIMHKVSNTDECSEEDEELEDDLSQTAKSNRLIKFQELVHSYFSSAEANTTNTELSEIIKDFPTDKALLACLSRDVLSLLQLVRANNRQIQTGVNISDPSCSDYRNLCLAKILHAIDAPRAPILNWYSHPLWGKYRSYSFGSVVQAVSSVCSELGDS